jgi:hypothetical protein
VLLPFLGLRPLLSDDVVPAPAVAEVEVALAVAVVVVSAGSTGGGGRPQLPELGGMLSGGLVGDT